MELTPILDLREDPPEPRRPRYGRRTGLVIGAVVGVVIVYITWNDTPSTNGLWILPALYLAVTVHELGHLLAGRIAGMKPGGIQVGGFSAMRSGRNYSIRFEWRRIVGGGTALLLTTNEQFTRRQFAWMVAGGPLASLVLTVAAALTPGGPWIHTLFWMSLLTMTSLIPFSPGINKSDGSRLRDLLLHPDLVDRWIGLIALQSEDRTGVRPRDWDSQLVETVLGTDCAASEYPYSELLLYYRALDEGRADDACVHLEHSLRFSAHAGTPVRYYIFLEAVSAVALIRKEAAHARTWLERARKLHRRMPGEAAEAAIAICEGRIEDALPLLKAAKDQLISKKLDTGIARFTLEKLNDYIDLCAIDRSSRKSVRQGDNQA